MNVSRAVIRQFATSGVMSGEVHRGYAKIKKIQQQFQKPDGKPVFLKAGTSDQILYRLTMVLTLVGIGGMAHLFFTLAVPPKEEE